MTIFLLNGIEIKMRISKFYFTAGILWNASTSHDENDIIDIEMQCDMLLVVSCLCEGDFHRKVISLCTNKFTNKVTKKCTN